MSPRFATGEAFGVWRKQAILDGFSYPYMTDYNDMPSHFLALEITFFALGVFTLFHSVSSKRIDLWLGFFSWGIVMETVGYLIKSHMHGQFVFQLLPFLPLKEVIWYPIILYPTYVTASRFQYTSPYGRAAMFGFISILTDVTYEVSNGRQGVGVAHINYNCEHAPLQLSNRVLDASMYICFSWSLLSSVLSIVIDKTEGMSFVPRVLAIGFALPLQYSLFLPVAALQYVTCYGKVCPRDSVVKPGALWGALAVIQILMVFNTIQQPTVSYRIRFNSLSIVPIGCNLVFLLFLWTSTESVEHRIDAACFIVLTTIFLVITHSISMKYPSKGMSTKRKQN